MDIPRTRLRSLHLLDNKLRSPQEVVARLGAVQAQDYAGAKWSLGLRLQNPAEAEVERAFQEGAILRTHLLRPTWHFVTPDDIGWLLALTAPRVHAVNASYYRKVGLDEDTAKRSRAALEKALAGGKHLTRDELRSVFEQAGISTSGELRMGYLLMRAELDGVICSGPRRGKQFTYALLAERASGARTLGREEALAELSLRYFLTRGPATVQDFAKWSGLTVSDGELGLEAVKSSLRSEVFAGKTYWLSPEGPAAGFSSPMVHLLSIYDEYISSYKDRSAIIDPDRAEKLIAMGNALSYIILIDGQIRGVWRRTLQKKSVSIEINRFEAFSPSEEEALAAAARSYGDFLGLTVELS